MTAMTIGEFQRKIEEIYFARDKARGMSGTFQWFVEEVGELAQALRGADKERLSSEFADVLAWLSTLASLAGVELEAAAVDKYGSGCPKCGRTPCGCQSEKP
jgi:NTP pyrophosphatase (non-canonical NTP hydrolase)